ncbi:CopD family protein [Candidatus Hepatobacter penaei]|uniref:CopD family protein n=1 Tax=Candidatus Hepatobacter penaei TaxID=1274402 RepID=UPI0004F3979A|nr:CopD family protein [Candidatus Hepatobacter penaei]
MTFLSEHYLIIKAIHILFVIAWMAGIMYLPRLFAYHKKHEDNRDIYAMFLTMERRLIAIIIIPSMVGTLITGGLLFLIPQAVNFSVWTPYVKLFFVGLLLAAQLFFLRCWQDFRHHQNKRSEVFFRASNEVPFLLAIVIVLLVVLKPF